MRLGRVFGSTIATVMVASSVMVGVATAARPVSLVDTSAGGVVATSGGDGLAAGDFGLVVADGESIGDALLRLVYNAPQFLPRVERSLSNMNPGTATFDVAAARRLVALERSARGSGVRAGTLTAPYEAPLIRSGLIGTGTAVATSAGSPTFSGIQRLDGLRCNSKGTCVLESTMYAYTTADLGYTTTRWLSKVAGRNAGWTSVSLSTYCSGGVRNACGSSANLAVTSSYSSTLYRFSRSMGGQTARFNTTFYGTYLGSPGGVSGWTPNFVCSSSDMQCRFQ